MRCVVHYTTQLKTHWITSERFSLSSKIKGFWYWHVISNQDKPCPNTVHLPSSDTAPVVLGTSHHLSGYLRPRAAPLMDKCVNIRSIWAERPHKPHLIPVWALKYEKCPQYMLRIQAGKKLYNKIYGVNMACEWGLQVSPHSRLNRYLYKRKTRWETWQQFITKNTH